MRLLAGLLLALIAAAPAAAQTPAITGAIAGIVEDEALAAGLDPLLMRRIAMIESGGDRTQCTGSYCGLFQLSESEFRRRGGQGSRLDARESARVTMKLFVEHADKFLVAHGRAPTATELYLIHQQGSDGLDAHLAAPERLAWQSMCTTGEGRARGRGWCRDAIWWNVPSDRRSEFGHVDNITSAQFVEMWRERVEGPRPPVVIAAVEPEPVRECRMADGRVGLFTAAKKAAP